MSKRLQHDCAWILAQHLLGIFENLLREEEKIEAFRECYAAALAAIETHDRLAERERHRLNPEPSKN